MKTNMNYELAKQLKDAGFLIIEHADRAPEQREYFQKLGGKDRLEIVYIPTLSELIEACGRIAVKISYQEDGRIYAEFDVKDEHGNYQDFCMYSLEEIYANLYLELNNKQPTKMSD